MGRQAGAAVCKTRLRSACDPLAAIVRRSEGCCCMWYVYVIIDVHYIVYIYYINVLYAICLIDGI